MSKINGKIKPAGSVKGNINVGAGGGSNNYPDLNNKPQINGVELLGNKTSKELGINEPTKTSQLENDSGFVTVSEIIDDTTPDSDKTYSSEKVEAIIDALLPIDTASGAAATFTTNLERPPVSITVDNSATKVYQRAANLWDETWEVGTYNTNTGAKSSSSTRIRSKDFIPIPPNSTLRFSPIGNGVGLSFLFYDQDKNFKAGYYRANTAGGFTYTTQEDWHFLTISPADAYGITYDNNISIRLDDSFEYSAYNTNSNEYSISELESIQTFNGLNNIFADSGDVSVSFKDGIQHYIDKAY